MKKNKTYLDEQSDAENQLMLQRSKKVERWKRTPEAKYMKEHCSRQYYETIQEMERPSYYYR